MDEIFCLEHTIGYFQVDHAHKIQLGSLFQLLQEAAIHHANQYEIGTRIMEDAEESWVLNRVALNLSRYPEFSERITIQTWASSLEQFKGFREFRYSAGEIIGKASTLWLYINLKKKSFTKLPEEILQTFPVGTDDLYFNRLDKLRLPKPGIGAAETSVSLRYGDIDGNQHVNNSAYMDFLQTALHHHVLDTRPHSIQIQFAREIPPDSESVTVRLESAESGYCFSLGDAVEVAAFGKLS